MKPLVEESPLLAGDARDEFSVAAVDHVNEGRCDGRMTVGQRQWNVGFSSFVLLFIFFDSDQRTSVFSDQRLLHCA